MELIGSVPIRSIGENIRRRCCIVSFNENRRTTRFTSRCAHSPRCTPRFFAHSPLLPHRAPPFFPPPRSSLFPPTLISRIRTASRKHLHRQLHTDHLSRAGLPASPPEVWIRNPESPLSVWPDNVVDPAPSSTSLLVGDLPFGPRL